MQELGFVDFFFNGDDRFVRTLKVLNDFAYAAAVNLLENISPVSWKNIILYGDILNRNKVVVK